MRFDISQPPSGGCVLKLPKPMRLPVAVVQPPSGGCVLKHITTDKLLRHAKPAAFRRLCVETSVDSVISATFCSSRLQAAVC